jgi:serine/threonine protein kinase
MLQDQNGSEEKTVSEVDRTLAETERTAREIPEPRPAPLGRRIWRDYAVVEELPALGGEADIFVVFRNEQRFILKLYRKGMEPKETVLARVKEISEQFPEHVIQLLEYGFDEETGRWYELLEYAPFGNLRSFLQGKTLNDVLLRELIEEINEGLKVLHEHGIIHRDLKPTNILVRRDMPPDLVFGDFGISSVIDPEVSKKQTSVKGTPLYSAPESFTRVMGKEVDYWSLGMILYEILAGANPFAGLDMRTIMYRLTTEDVPIPEVSEEYRPLLQGLLTRNPRKRWGYEEVRRWCQGERDIPVFYGEKEVRYGTPYPFMGKSYGSLEELALAFMENTESFEHAARHLVKEHLKTWCSQNNDLGRVIWLDDVVATSKSPEEMVVRVVYTLHRSLPFALYGETITPQRLSEILGKKLTGGLTEGEKKIIALLDDGRLQRILTVYEELTGRKEGELEKYLEEYAKLVEKSQNTTKLLRFFYIIDPEKPFRGVDGSCCTTKEELAECLERNFEHYSKELQDSSASFYLFLEARGFGQEAEAFRAFFKGGLPPEGALNRIILALQSPYFIFQGQKFQNPEELLKCDDSTKSRLLEELQRPHSKLSLWIANSFPELQKSVEWWRSLKRLDPQTLRYALGQGFESGEEVARSVDEFRGLLRRQAKNIDLKEANYWLRYYMGASLNELIFSLLESSEVDEENVRALLSFGLRNQEDSTWDASLTIRRYDMFMEKWVARHPDSSLAERYRREKVLREARVREIRAEIERDREWEKQKVQRSYDAILEQRRDEARRSEDYRYHRAHSIAWFTSCALSFLVSLVGFSGTRPGDMAAVFAVIGGIIGFGWGILAALAGKGGWAILGGIIVGTIGGAILGAVCAAVPYIPMVFSIISAVVGILYWRKKKEIVERRSRLTLEESARLSESLQAIDGHFGEKARAEITRAVLEILAMDDGEFWASPRNK